jgi:mRNA interferase RelE/StbE
MSSWVLRHSAKFQKSMSKMDPHVRRTISLYLNEILHIEDPRTVGTGLGANLSGFWRYRVGDYRIIVHIMDEELVVLAVNVGHRSKIYRS